MKYRQVMERVSEPRRLQAAWQQVRSNAGAAGIDQMTVADFEQREGELLALIHEKLKGGTYRFKPARRTLIPKEGTSRPRKLGIPVVMDRIVAQSVNSVFADIFDPSFTRSNFGFRRGHSQHQAIGHVRQIVIEGYEWCASIDLESFFDEIAHDLILRLIRRQIADERLITLVARALKAGVIIDGRYHKTNKGCPQGSPLSPMLSNIVLNELDQELERRGHRYCRWADDFLVLVRSERAAQRVVKGIIRYLEEDLRLVVNREKSQAAPVKDVSFVGFQILRGKIRVSDKARVKFKARVRELTRRNNPLSIYQIIQELNEYLRGWVGYFKIQEFKRPSTDLDGWIRSRLRSMQLKKWKNPGKFQRMMIRAGYRNDQVRRRWVKMNKWQSVKRKEVRFVMNLQWFRMRGLIFLKSFLQKQKPLELTFTR
ncbi:MAG: group II intron reverse transcriptase/maturase [Deltaproteobacteria bacterium]|nr:group II intron reverse transcriptase/maturase [Deltaproteobacteria bacterium]MBW2150277.1 group II intron reverse transcriptase/maturase [Deltaproteobacteria bacterium]